MHATEVTPKGEGGEDINYATEDKRWYPDQNYRGSGEVNG